MKDIIKTIHRMLPLILVIWSISLIISGISQLSINTKTVNSIAEFQARTAYEKDLLYRQWASSHGGVYVPITENTLPNPALSHIKDRDIETSSGLKLTLVNPAYMTRQVHELGKELYKLKGHITSLNPINPVNGPDPWERKTLKSFTYDSSDRTEIVEANGTKELRFMKALYVEESCLKCHEIQGYKVGDLRGGISISVDITQLDEAFTDVNKSIIIRHITIWLIGFVIILCIGLIIKKGIKNHTENSEKLYQSKLVEEKEREYLSVTLKSIGEGVIATDTYGKITKMNNIAEGLTGWFLKEALGRDLSDVFNISDENDPDQKISIFKLIMYNNPKVVMNENYILTDRSDNNYQINNSSSLIKSSNGDIIGIVVVFRDMTAENELQRQLRQSQKLDAVGQLTSGIAHDFNNMISGIMGGTELLQHHLMGDSKSQKYLSLIMDSSLRAADLTKKLLTFSKVQNIDLKPVDIHKALTDSISLLENTLDKKIELHKELYSVKSIIKADITMLQNIFMNLAINSSHAMPNGGRISFKTCNVQLDSDYCLLNSFNISPGDYIEIEIEDNGSGISKDVLPHIFDPFFTTKEQGKGTGLGLSVIYGNIKKLKGSITVKSKIGEGTTFNILLPITKENVAESTVKNSVNYHGKGVVLLVDDEEILRTVGQDLLKDLGYDVLLANNGYEGLSVFNDNIERIDLVILDMIMPVMNGLECYNKIRKIDRDLPIIIASGYSSQVDIDGLIRAGCNNFISKPYSASEVSKLVSELLNKKE